MGLDKATQTESSPEGRFRNLPRDVVFNDFIKDDFIPEGDGQITSGSVSLSGSVSFSDRVVLETGDTEEQGFQREKNECDVHETLDDYKCDVGMSVENVPAVVNIKTLTGRFIAHRFNKFSIWLTVGVVKSVETKNGKKSVPGPFESRICLGY